MINYIYSVIIQPQNVQIQVELESTTTVKQLYELIQANYKIQDSIETWSCFSALRQFNLNINDKIGNFENDTFTINTKPNISQELAQTSINLFINIIDGHVKKAFQTQINQNSMLEEVSQLALTYCQLSNYKHIATADLFIFNQPYNDSIKRQKTLFQLQIKNNQTIEAKIRWFGGFQK